MFLKFLLSHHMYSIYVNYTYRILYLLFYFSGGLVYLCVCVGSRTMTIS